MLLCGNGEMVSDAQHIAAELSGRFYNNRSHFMLKALHVNSSYLTAVANDFGYVESYARMLRPVEERRCLDWNFNFRQFS